MKKIFFIVILLIIASGPSIDAQENYYWNLQYGTRSTLLGGAVIGSVSDLSATYYNPGAIALFKDAQFILSAQVYQLDNYTVKNGAAEGIDLEFSSIRPSPTFVAFDIDFNFLGDDKLAFSVLTRQNSVVELNTRLIDSIDVIQSVPGKENFAGGTSLEKEFVDVWGGLTYSTKLSELIGIGLTGYLSYNSNDLTTETILQALLSSGEIASFTNINKYEYTNARALLKAGVGINLAPLTIGITATTPSLNLFGSGSVGTHLFLSGVDSTIFQSNYQDDVKSEYKSSWTLGLGAAYRINDFKIHVSTEWFDMVEKFFVLDTEQFTAQGSGDIIINDVTHETKSIINYGLGIDYFLKERFIISASFVTDFSARDPNSTTNLTIAANWDIYHFALGSTFQVGKSDITVGAAYSFGSDVFENNIDIRPVEGEDPKTTRESEVDFTRIKILLGFVF